MKKILLFLLIVIIISSCEYFSIMSKKEWLEKTGKEDDVIIYVAGAYQSGVNAIPCYWKIKDDKIERVDLENESRPSNGANSIYVVGDNVYTCGYVELPITGQIQACYWINTKRYDLDISLANTFAYSIKVKSGVVFTSGMDGSNAFYWINKEKIELNIRTANSIFIENVSSSKHVAYIGGQNLKTPSQACFYKDGDIVDLPPLINLGELSDVRSIYVIGNTVYSVGTLIKNPGPVQNACLWKNTDLIILPYGTYAHSVFVSNEDIYIAGEQAGANIYACYWKNKNFISLPNSGIGDSIALSIYTFNNNIYIAGSDNSYACYWLNDQQKFIETSLNSMANSIFVTYNNEN